jgi:3-dehydrosphinganine reductase
MVKMTETSSQYYYRNQLPQIHSSTMSMLKIILAGILALPCLLVTVCVAPLMALLAIPSLLLLLLRKAPSGLSKKNPPDHVIIAGGSSGIGLCIAQECVKLGVKKITLLARNPKKLKQAAADLEQLADLQKLLDVTKAPPSIQTYSISVSDFAELETVAASLEINKKDRIALFNCAGISYTTEFEKVPPEECFKLVQTNQMGSMFVVKAFLPYLEQGVITLTSSVAAQAGVYGYASYAPTKCAIAGFAQCMTHELLTTKPNLHLQVAYPADTNTPGYEEETKMMPAITKALNETAGLADPSEYVQLLIETEVLQSLAHTHSLVILLL